MTDFWNTLDAAISLMAAKDGGQLAAWTLVRPFGSSEYHVVVKRAGRMVDFPPPADDPVSLWLARMSIPVTRLAEYATAAATEMVAEARWTPVHETEQGWVRGAWRRPSSLAWQADDELSNMYWSSASEGHGLPDHAWLAQLREDLTSPINPASRRRVLGALGRLLSSYENWEERSGLSLRAWSSEDPAWQDMLDQAGLGYSARHQGYPLLVAALEREATSPGWRRIIEGALDHRIEWIVPPSDLPSSWWEENRLGPAPSLPLWSWAARVASSEAWRLMLEQRPDLISAVDANGCSALHWAALSGNESVVTLLLERGANPAVENLAGLMPEEVVPSGKDSLYEQIANKRLDKRSPSA